MPIPTYDQLIAPLLRLLFQTPEGIRKRDAEDSIAKTLVITDDERALLIPSGVQTVFDNRVSWAHDRLKRAGYSESAKKGFWRLTEAGVASRARINKVSASRSY